MPEKPQDAPREVVELRVGGVSYAGWQTVEIEGGLDALAATFHLGLADRADADLPPFVVSEGDACEIWIGPEGGSRELVLRGWVEDVDDRIDDGSHTVTVSGRDRTGDLVDCSALNSPGSWAGRSLEQILGDLAAPFGIKVSAEADTGAPFASFALQPGEHVYEAMERLYRQRAVLPVSTPSGDIRLIRPGQATAPFALSLGAELLSVSRRENGAARYSEYVLKGQSQSIPGHKAVHGEFLLGTADVAAVKARKAAGAKAAAVDPGVHRYRPLMIVAEDQAGGGGSGGGTKGSSLHGVSKQALLGGATSEPSLAQRAQWEATVRAGKAHGAVATLCGWRDPSGKLWAADLIVPIHAARVGVDEPLLVSGRKLSDGENGQQVELTLVRKEAYSLIDLADSHKPTKTRKPKAKKGKKVDALLTGAIE